MKSKLLIFLVLLIFFCSCKKQETPIESPTSSEFPIANFSITNTGCLAPCQVIFTNNSSDATSFEWDFGDGTTSTDFSPSHTYELPGEYIVRLKAVNNDGEDVETKPIPIIFRTFKQTFGGARTDRGFSVQQTQDDGYILLGLTGSPTIPGNSGGSTGIDGGDSGIGTGIGTGMYLVKVDNSGILVWQRAFRNEGITSSGASVQQTEDGGYILLGSAGLGGIERGMYLIKTDSGGNVVWEQTYNKQGGLDDGNSVQQTEDGGYILLGSTTDITQNDRDVSLIKTDNLGNIVWQRTFGETASERGYSIQQTQDGGYILVSDGVLGNIYAHLIKIDNAGNTVWKQIYDGINRSRDVQQTEDGGYILSGTSPCSDGGGGCLFLMKTDNRGDLLWKQTFGRMDYAAFGSSVQQTKDGGFVLLGNLQGTGPDEGMYMLKTDSEGNLIWERTFGGPGTDPDRSSSIQQTNDGGYVLIGTISDEDIESADMCLIKTDSEGNVN